MAASSRTMTAQAWRSERRLSQTKVCETGWSPAVSVGHFVSFPMSQTERRKQDHAVPFSGCLKLPGCAPVNRVREGRHGSRRRQDRRSRAGAPAPDPSRRPARLKGVRLGQHGPIAPEGLDHRSGGKGKIGRFHRRRAGAIRAASAAAVRQEGRAEGVSELKASRLALGVGFRTFLQTTRSRQSRSAIASWSAPSVARPWRPSAPRGGCPPKTKDPKQLSGVAASPFNASPAEQSRYCLALISMVLDQNTAAATHTPPLPDQARPTEKVGLHLQEVETLHILRRIDPAQFQTGREDITLIVG